jgi:transposase
MRDNDGRKLDHAVLEAIRIRAVQQIRAGTRPDDVAAALGLNRSTVFAWFARYRDGGLDALRAKSVPGRPSTLSADQLRQLSALVVDGDPRPLGFGSALWTRTAIRALIHREFAVDLSTATVGRLLHASGLSSNRPTHRDESDERVRARWWTENFRYNHAVGAATYGIRFVCELTDGSGKRPGAGPVSVASAVTVRGTRWFAAYRGELTAQMFLDFATRLLHDAAGPVLLLADEHPVYRSRAVTEAVRATGRRLHIVLPPTGHPPTPPHREWTRAVHTGHTPG